MKVSYSRVSKFSQCPFMYKLLYLDKLKPLFDGKPDNALALGTAIHEGIEKNSIDEAIKAYTDYFESLNKDNDIEILKMKTILPKALTQIPRGVYEYELNIDDEFTGFIDCLSPNDDGTYDIIDFKYAKNADRYLTSPQVHLYKYYYEKLTGNKIKNIYYAVVPKCKETLSTMSEDKLLKHINNTYANKDIQLVKVDYDIGKVYKFLAQKAVLEQAKTFDKVYSTKCAWCQFQKFCRTNGKDRSEIDPPVKEVDENTSLF